MDVTKAYRNICRLCLGDDAVDVTHMKYKDKMLELLSASSGIVDEDLRLFPNKICESCCVFALKLYSYRRIAAENNKLLKGLFAQKSTAQSGYRTQNAKDEEKTRRASKCMETGLFPFLCELASSQTTAARVKSLRGKGKRIRYTSVPESCEIEEHEFCTNLNKTVPCSNTKSMPDMKSSLEKSRTINRDKKKKERPGKKNVFTTIVTRSTYKQRKDLVIEYKRKMRRIRRTHSVELKKVQLINSELLDSEAHKAMFLSSLELVPTNFEASDESALMETNTDLGNSSMFNKSSCRSQREGEIGLQRKPCVKKHSTILKPACNIELLKTSPVAKLRRMDEDVELIKKYPDQICQIRNASLRKQISGV